MPADILLTALRHVWTTLIAAGATPALMGGLALSAWKHVRATKDVDLLVGLGPLQFDALWSALNAASIHPKRQPPIVELGRLRIAQWRYEPPDAFVELQVDLMLAECDYQIQSLARRVPIVLPELDIPIAVLSCEDLILHKLMAGRIIDRSDILELLRANRGTLDGSYLEYWAVKLQLNRELAAIWQDAYPGTAPRPFDPS